MNQSFEYVFSNEDLAKAIEYCVMICTSMQPIDEAELMRGMGYTEDRKDKDIRMMFAKHLEALLEIQQKRASLVEWNDKRDQ